MMYNFIKIILVVTISLSVIHAEKIELISSEVFNNSVEDYLNIQEDKEMDLKQKEAVYNQKIENLKEKTNLLMDKKKYQLKLNITPKNANVIFLKPKDISYTYGDSLPEGNYTIKIERNGYKSQEITIKLNRPISERIKLIKTTQYCKLAVIPKISGTKIQILNIKKQYQRNISLPCNKRYDIKVTKKGYKDKLFYTSLKTNETIRPNLKRKYITPKYCSLTIIPNTNRARVRITNILPPYKNGIRLPCGRKYHIKVSQRGYKTRRFSTILKSNERIKVKLRR